MTRLQAKACPCEGCKEARASRWVTWAEKRDRILTERRAREAAAGVFETVIGRIKASADAEWVQGDGTKVRVQAMSDAHLFFAIAKGMRGDYKNPWSPPTRDMRHLKNEALRRLIGGTWPEGGR